MTTNRLNDNPNFQGALEKHLELYVLPEGIIEDDLNFYEFEPKNPLATSGVMIAVPFAPRGKPGNNSASYFHYHKIKDSWIKNKGL